MMLRQEYTYFTNCQLVKFIIELLNRVYLYIVKKKRIEDFIRKYAFLMISYRNASKDKDNTV